MNSSYPILRVGIFVDTSYAIGVGLFNEHFLISYPTLGVGLFVNTSFA